MQAKHSDDGLTSWLWQISQQLGAFRETLGEVKAGQANNRQTVIDFARYMTHRMDRFEDKIEVRLARAKINGSGRHGWLKWIPWDRLAFGTLSLLGALGWIKPSWLAWVKQLFGP